MTGRLRLLVVFLAALCCSIAAECQAGWQRDMVCQGECGGACGACPGVRATPRERPERAERQEAPQETSEERSKREAAQNARARAYYERQALIAAQMAEVSAVIRSRLPANTAVLTPTGSRTLSQREPATDPETTFAGPVGGIATPASGITLENLRRAAVILGAASAATGLSREDQSYVANQAAQAMEGAPLSIVVPEGRSLRADFEETTQDFVKAAQALERTQKEADQATAARVRIEGELARVQSDLRAAGGDAPPALQKKRDELLADYRAAARTETNSVEAVKTAKKQVRIIVVP